MKEEDVNKLIDAKIYQYFSFEALRFKGTTTFYRVVSPSYLVFFVYARLLNAFNQFIDIFNMS